MLATHVLPVLRICYIEVGDETVQLTCYCVNCNVSLIPIEKKPGEEDDEEEEDQEDQGTLLTSLADAQTRQREKAAYEQLKAGGTILFFQASFSKIKR